MVAPDGAPPPLPHTGLPNSGPPPLDFSDDGENGFSPQFGCGEPPCKCVTHFWSEFEWVLWWIKERQLPSLVTMGSADDLAPGAIGQPNTHALFGNNGSDANPFNGGRFWLGYWCDDEHIWGIEGNAFFLENRVSRFDISGNGDIGSPVLARPFINLNTGAEDASGISVPGVQAGRIVIAMPRNFFGAEANLRISQPDSALCHSRLSLILGACYLNLYEQLNINESLTDLTGLGTSTAVDEHFTAFNQFYGGQIGLGWDWHIGSMFVSIDGRVAFGTNRESQRVAGGSAVTSADGTVTANPNQALLVQPSNVGRTTRDEFSYVPELTFHIGYNFNKYINIAAGYNFLYWHGVSRSGENLDALTPGLLTAPSGATRPTPPVLGNSNFWAQGLSLSLGISF
jgi:hypothetical protein